MPVVSTQPVGVHGGPQIALTNQTAPTQTENNATVRGAPDGARAATAQLLGLSEARAAPNVTPTGVQAIETAQAEPVYVMTQLPEIAALRELLPILSATRAVPTETTWAQNGAMAGRAAPIGARTAAARIPGIARRGRRQNNLPLTTLTPILPGRLFDGQLQFTVSLFGFIILFVLNQLSFNMNCFIPFKKRHGLFL